MKKVLVFGATGTVGAYTCIYLKERGYDVIAVGHRKDDNGFFALHDMKYYSVDICNQDDFNKFLFRFKVNCTANFLESGGLNVMDAVQQKEWLQSENHEFLFQLMQDEE